jgi:hypothetical protein
LFLKLRVCLNLFVLFPFDVIWLAILFLRYVYVCFCLGGVWGGYQVSLQLVPLLMAERIGLGLGETTAADFAVGETAGQRRERQRLSQAGAKRPTPAPHAH